MYVQLRESLAPARAERQSRWWAPLSVPRTVLALGLTSLFTDISSEMVATVLPLYFVIYLGLTPLEFGVLDGLYQGAAALVRVGSGFVADRYRRAKEVAFLGYALSAACKLGLLMTTATGAIAAIVVLDRTGKGVRTAPRDAMISLSVPREQLATAFGVHRAFDTIEAMLGPLVAFGVLALAPGAFDAVFVVSFCVALIGLAILGLVVEQPRSAGSASGARPSLGTMVESLHDRRFRRLVLAGAMLSLATVSDGFVFLLIQQHLSLSTSMFPLLFVATSLAYFALALPAGRLADRVGRARVFLGGYGLLVACLVMLLVWPLGSAAAPLVVLLLGAYYAATDGVLMALGGDVLPEQVRGTGLGLLAAATSLARLLSSVLFGVLWTWWGSDAALAAFAIALLGAIVVARMTLAGSASPVRMGTQ